MTHVSSISGFISVGVSYISPSYSSPPTRRVEARERLLLGAGTAAGEMEDRLRFVVDLIVR
jgi:hypothetical protein